MMPSLQIVPERFARPDETIGQPAPHLAEREPVAKSQNPPTLGKRGPGDLANISYWLFSLNSFKHIVSTRRGREPRVFWCPRGSVRGR
jgi:hypothetical protein